MRGWLERAARTQTGEGYVRVYESLANNLTLYCGMTLLPFESRAAVWFDNWKAAKMKVGTQDLKIAAIAMANDAVVLTRNTRHFGKVPGLRVEDWTI